MLQVGVKPCSETVRVIASMASVPDGLCTPIIFEVRPLPCMKDNSVTVSFELGTSQVHIVFKYDF